MKDSVVFSCLMDEYGNLEQEEDAENKDQKGEKEGASSDTREESQCGIDANRGV